MPTRLIAAVLVALLLAAPARATWSIVLVDHRTGEVCVAAATCINNFQLAPALCVIRVGEGAAAAQSVVDTTGVNRLVIWDELADGTAPNDILSILAAQDSQHQRRQYGIVSVRAGSASFTGTQCAAARIGVSGRDGDVSYAIQGNILAGTIVVERAEQALLTTFGDLPTRAMSAMLAARHMGGDGRCSCSTLMPTSCGAPPTNFTYSASTAFLIAGRLGDVDGVCTPSQGCANGQYWCDLRVIEGPPGGQDPVLRMANQTFPAWRASLAQRADHVRTRVEPDAARIPADGATTIAVDVQLVNVEGDEIAPPGAEVLVAGLSNPPVAVASASTDLGGGRHRFTLASDGAAGLGRFRLEVRHADGKRVRLWPDLELDAVAPAPLVCGRSEVGAAAGEDALLFVDLGASSAGAAYVVLGTSSGTAPGFVFQGVTLPLNRDRFLGASWLAAPGSPFQSTHGVLDAQGRAVARFAPPPGFLAPLVGRRVDWAAWIGGASPTVTNADGFLVLP